MSEEILNISLYYFTDSKLFQTRHNCNQLNYNSIDSSPTTSLDDEWEKDFDVTEEDMLKAAEEIKDIEIDEKVSITLLWVKHYIYSEDS